jgi:hypothetical protein
MTISTRRSACYFSTARVRVSASSQANPMSRFRIRRAHGDLSRNRSRIRRRGRCSSGCCERPKARRLAEPARSDAPFWLASGPSHSPPIPLSEALSAFDCEEDTSRPYRKTLGKHAVAVGAQPSATSSSLQAVPRSQSPRSRATRSTGSSAACFFRWAWRWCGDRSGKSWTGNVSYSSLSDVHYSVFCSEPWLRRSSALDSPEVPPRFRRAPDRLRERSDAPGCACRDAARGRPECLGR